MVSTPVAAQGGDMPCAFWAQVMRRLGNSSPTTEVLQSLISTDHEIVAFLEDKKVSRDGRLLCEALKNVSLMKTKIDLWTQEDFVKLYREMQLPEDQDSAKDNQEGKTWKMQKLTKGFKKKSAVDTASGSAVNFVSANPKKEATPNLAAPLCELPALRIVARLDIKGPNVVKGIQMEGIRSIGQPSEFAMNYYQTNADEILYLDLVASLYEKGRTISFLKSCMQNGIFIPLCVGGGIRSLENIAELLQAGADKVAINTQAIKNPDFISAAARTFGAQCIVGHIDCASVQWNEQKVGLQIPSGWEPLYDCGRERSYKDAVEWAKELAALGCGELVITCIDRDGSRTGFDVDLCTKMLDAVSIPVILSGGAGSPSDLLKICEAMQSSTLHKKLPSGLAVASILHYKEYTVPQLKSYLVNSTRIPIRLQPNVRNLAQSQGNSNEYQQDMHSQRVIIIDHGIGNLASVVSAFSHLGCQCIVTKSPADISLDTPVVLPGVGAFQEGMNALSALGLIEPLKLHCSHGGRLLGICLGAQMLLESSEEFGFWQGLGILKGRSVAFDIGLSTLEASAISIPHIGWSKVKQVRALPMNEILTQQENDTDTRVYFDHSYHFVDVDHASLMCDYAGIEFVAAFSDVSGKVIGVQFHPEKSGILGLEMFRNFVCRH